MLAAKRYHRHAASWIDAAADEEQITADVASLRRLEGEVLAPIADYAVNGAAVGSVSFLDIERRPEVLDYDVLAQVGKPHALQLCQAEIFQRNAVLVAVRILVVDVRNVGKNLDIVAPLRRLRGVCACRRNQIDGGIVGQPLVVKDAIEVTVLMTRIEEVMVGELRIDAIEAQMHHDPRAGRLEPVQLFQFPASA